MISRDHIARFPAGLPAAGTYKKNEPRTMDFLCAFVKAAIMVVAVVSATLGATFYVDPVRGAPDNDGSAARPWRTLKEVIESGCVATREWASYPYQPGVSLVPKNPAGPIKGGDTILLRSGDHDSVLIQRAYNSALITIAAEPGQRPRLRKLIIQAAENWYVCGVTISAQSVNRSRKLTLVSIASHGYSGPLRHVTVENCSLYSTLDASQWTIDEWNDLTPNAIAVNGRKVTIRRNYIKNVDFGISVSGDSCLIEDNVVENFAGDGLRGLGNDTEFRGNVVMNCYDVNANHDDGFQSWSVGGANGTTVGEGTVYRVRLVGNTIINYTDPNQPFRGTLQGIGCFDGFFEGWVIENNVVITDHWHGITLLGARNCRIVNNTVCDLNTVSPGPPWIRIGAHKTRGPSGDCIVRNNLTTAINNDANSSVVVDHNIIINDPNAFFVNYAERNLQLRAGCLAVDAGSAELAPDTDILGVRRPQGKAVDVGAYEYSPLGVWLKSQATALPAAHTSRPHVEVFPAASLRSRALNVSLVDGRLFFLAATSARPSLLPTIRFVAPRR